MTRAHVETDAMLRRFERNQVIACLGVAALAALVTRFDIALGALGGGLLMAISYRAIKGGVDAIMPAGPGPGPAGQEPAEAGSHDTKARATQARRRAWLVARFVGRYALLALAAYVMLACLHAHPVGLLLGAASPVAAVAAEAVHVLRAWSRPGQSRQS
jgi:hypothetical protein